MTKTCVTCGDEFEFKTSKPGLATECPGCTEKNPSLQVRQEVRTAALREMQKSTTWFNKELPRGLQIQWRRKQRPVK
jgi:hypothetical protein